GACGGGNGGRGSANSTGPTYPETEAGYGPFQVPDKGGRGGKMSCEATCQRGSGGGGGSMATQGDPYFKSKWPGGTSTTFVQQVGRGGYGCNGTSPRPPTLPGGNPGPLAFGDKRNDNDFWGSAINRQKQIRVTGELKNPVGGQGGGGG